MTTNFNVKDAELMRFEVYAERILENTLHRRRWLAHDRDELAIELRKIIRAEERISARKKGEVV